MLELLPSAPPIDGVLGADVTLHLAPDSLCLRGDVSVSELSYAKQRFGNLDFGLFYGQGRDTGPMHGSCWTAPRR